MPLKCMLFPVMRTACSYPLPARKPTYCFPSTLQHHIRLMAEPIKGCLHSLQWAINRDCLVYVLICDRRLVLDPALCMHRHHHHSNGRTWHLGVLLGTWALQG